MQMLMFGVLIMGAVLRSVGSDSVILVLGKGFEEERSGKGPKERQALTESWRCLPH